MNSKCNNCAKFLTCNRNKCEKISFTEAGILEKPKIIKRNYVVEAWERFGISTQEAAENLTNTMKKLSTQISQSKK